ncbi:acyl-CoA synthetase (AMP-forming)/AMP-acid ligase II [Bradyrhizobium sp. LM6.10]
MAEDMIPLGEKLSRSAQMMFDKTAVSCGETTITWGQLEARARRIARALEGLGVKFGDLVTIGLPNSVDFIEACWGVWKLGATPQPVSFRLPRAELQAIVELADPSVVIALPGMETDRPRVTVPDLLKLSEDDSPLKSAAAPCLGGYNVGRVYRAA